MSDELKEALEVLGFVAGANDANEFINDDSKWMTFCSHHAAAILDHIAAQDKRIAELETMLNEAIYERNIEAEIAGGCEKTLSDYEYDLSTGIIAPEAPTPEAAE